MAGERIEVELPAELAEGLRRLARALGIASDADAVLIVTGEWVANHRAEMEAAGAAQKYFVNQALDELIANSKTK